VVTLAHAKSKALTWGLAQRMVQGVVLVGRPRLCTLHRIEGLQFAAEQRRLRAWRSDQRRTRDRGAPARRREAPTRGGLQCRGEGGAGWHLATVTTTSSMTAALRLRLRRRRCSFFPRPHPSRTKAMAVSLIIGRAGVTSASPSSFADLRLRFHSMGSSPSSFGWSLW
jgi:hypothetical protein